MDQDLLRMGETIDDILNIDINGRGIIGILRHAARAKIGKPLAMAAAAELAAVCKPGSSVIIATGATGLRIGIDPKIGEMDGPPGAVGLARGLGKALRIVPVLLTEESQVEPLAKVATGVGLTRTTFDGSFEQATKCAYNTSVVIDSFPADDAQAKTETDRILRRLAPAAIVTVEKGGMNEAGIYHNSLGIDTSEGKAKVDYLIAEAFARKIPTIGIGDGGNEIGMSLIADVIKERIPFGKRCQCPCQKGIAPVTKVNYLVTAAVSNWGAYAILAALSLILNRRDILHTPELEDRAIRASAAVGYLDPGGYCDLSVDGMPAKVHFSFLELLNMAVSEPYRELKRIGWGTGKKIAQ